MTVVLRPAYSLDLASSDLFLSPKVKIKLNERRFDTIEEIEGKSHTVLNTLTKRRPEHSFLGKDGGIGVRTAIWYYVRGSGGK
ncbi:hypothetical protein Trydic_g8192 [Trypoxylus dichotomus]